jgi:purine nucleosidase
MRTFLIDTDTASDDAVALVMALRAPDVRVAGITVVSGNVPLAQATANALYSAEMSGATDVPVFSGCDRPLLREPSYADWFHGSDGMGEQNYPPAKKRPESVHGVDAIVELVRANPGLTLVTLGPLTNIAMAIRREPRIVRDVARCVVMGGNPCCEGNVTPAAEFNIWVDPEAAAIVFGAGLPIEMVGWQLCRGVASLDPSDIAHVRALNTTLAHFAIDCNRTAMKAHQTQTGEIGIGLPDPVAMAVAIDPTIATGTSAHRVGIECDSELTRGQTVVDRLSVSADPRNGGRWSGAGGATSSIVWAIDVPRWKQLLYASLTR